MDIIEPSLVPPSVYRCPFITYETRPDPADKTAMVTVALANVRLQTGHVAQLDLEDFNRLMRGGFSDQWFLHSNGGRNSYVRTTQAGVKDKLFTVARLIVGGTWGTRVRYRDRNSLNLRRSNFKVGEGFSKGHEADALANPGGTLGAMLGL